MVDIWIAVALGLLTASHGLLGVHVTLHPAQTHPQKNAYKCAFIVCALAICGLIFVQGLRNKRSQDALSTSLGVIAKNTSTPPQVINNLPAPQVILEAPQPQQSAKAESDTYMQVLGIVPVKTNLSPGNQLQVAVYFGKYGKKPIRTLRGVELMFGDVADEVNMQKRIFERYRKQIRVEKTPFGPVEETRGTSGYETATSAPIKQSDLDGWAAGVKRLYVLAHLRWKNEDGSIDELFRCSWIYELGSVEMRGKTSLVACKSPYDN